MVQSGGTLMWVLDDPVAATAAAAPVATPTLATQLIQGRYTRVLTEPGPAKAAVPAAPAGDARIGSSASASRLTLGEQVLPGGARLLALPADVAAPAVAQPALVERLIVPGQPGTQPGDLPAANTLYRATPSR